MVTQQRLNAFNECSEVQTEIKGLLPNETNLMAVSQTSRQT